MQNDADFFGNKSSPNRTNLTCVKCGNAFKSVNSTHTVCRRCHFAKTNNKTNPMPTTPPVPPRIVQAAIPAIQCSKCNKSFAPPKQDYQGYCPKCIDTICFDAFQIEVVYVLEIRTHLGSCGSEESSKIHISHVVVKDYYNVPKTFTRNDFNDLDEVELVNHHFFEKYSCHYNACCGKIYYIETVRLIRRSPSTVNEMFS